VEGVNRARPEASMGVVCVRRAIRPRPSQSVSACHPAHRSDPSAGSRIWLRFV
jgi:hypothetical protein